MPLESHRYYHLHGDSVLHRLLSSTARKIDVPLESPFKYDKLGRGSEINNVSLFLPNRSSPIATTERYSHLTVDSMANASCRVSDVLKSAMPVTTNEPEPETVCSDG